MEKNLFADTDIKGTAHAVLNSLDRFGKYSHSGSVDIKINGPKHILAQVGQWTQTHTGSSGSMECSIANKIWDCHMAPFRIHMGVVKPVKNGKMLISNQQITKNGVTLKGIPNGNKLMTPVKQSPSPETRLYWTCVEENGDSFERTP